jgi:isopentenyl-diphosphate delta-isomerase type 1
MTGFELYLACCAAVSFFTLALTLRNLGLYRKPNQPGTSGEPSVSVCIPCRNEERNVAEIVGCVLKSQHRPIEILLYDDDSTDATGELVNNLSSAFLEVRTVQARPLPLGWCGKQHACHRLAAEARGEWILFLDADVRIEPDAIGSAIGFAHATGSALVSTFPRQKAGTLGELLIVPMMFYLLLGYLPFKRMRRTLSPAASAGCGQFMLANHDAYEKVGGHEAVKDSMHDGIKLPRAFRRNGFRTDIFDGSHLANVRMYTGFRQTWNGFAKNAYEGLGSAGLLIFLTALHLVVHIAPWVLLPILVLSGAGASSIALCASAVGLQLLQRLALTIRFSHPASIAFMHPVSILLLTGVQWQSFALQLRSCRSWKGRTMSTHQSPQDEFQERVVLVDSEDREVGTSEKIAAHTEGGKLHRAFSVFILDGKDRLMLQQRADSKYHFGGFWTNTCCGHPRPGEEPMEAARRRLFEEMGFTTQLAPRGVFQYRAIDDDSGLTEHEIDHVFVGRFNGEPVLNLDEATDWRWVDLQSLSLQLQTQPEKFTPWFPIALAELAEYQSAASLLPPTSRSGH